jgi:hypothetical protein
VITNFGPNMLDDFVATDAPGRKTPFAHTVLQTIHNIGRRLSRLSLPVGLSLGYVLATIGMVSLLLL